MKQHPVQRWLVIKWKSCIQEKKHVQALFSFYIRVRVGVVLFAWLGARPPEAPDGASCRHEAGKSVTRHCDDGDPSSTHPHFDCTKESGRSAPEAAAAAAAAVAAPPPVIGTRRWSTKVTLLFLYYSIRQTATLSVLFPCRLAE